MKKSLKLQQIAELTGCSLTQISRALNGKGRVSAASRRKILECARSINYHNTARRPQRIAILRGEDYYFYTLYNHFDSMLACMNIQTLNIKQHSADFLQQLPLELLVALDLPGDIGRRIAELLNVPLLEVRLFSCGQADIVMDWATVFDAAQNYFDSHGCCNKLLLLPELAHSEPAILPGKNAFEVKYIAAADKLDFLESIPAVRRFDAIFSLLPDIQNKFLHNIPERQLLFFASENIINSSDASLYADIMQPYKRFRDRVIDRIAAMLPDK